MKLNNKGFTLVEVLTTIAILAILMMVAVPNIIGVINNNKSRVYVSDAKKLHTLAEYKVNTVQNGKPLDGECVKYYFNYLDNGEFVSAPNDGDYTNNSYVLVSKDSGSAYGVYNYYIYLEEVYGNDNLKGGISFTTVDALYADNNVDLVKNGSELSSSLNGVSCSVTRDFNKP